MNILEQQAMEHLCNLDSKIPELTLRDLFAMSVLNAIRSITTYQTDYTYRAFAEMAYKQADEMIKVRKGE